jgi:xylulose-5-phosphate/fructose-6-phosphate phosphoketolase
MCGIGDVVTAEALAATALLKENMPGIKIRFVNVIDLFRLVSHQDHPHGMASNSSWGFCWTPSLTNPNIRTGLTDKEFDSIFTRDKPVIVAFHSYPWLIHRLTYRRVGSRNIHVRGYMEKGNIDTPLELAIRNKADRFSLAIEALDRMPHLNNRGSAVRGKLRDEQLRAVAYAFDKGIDV